MAAGGGGGFPPDDPRSERFRNGEDPRPWWYKEDRAYDRRKWDKIEVALTTMNTRLGGVEDAVKGEERDKGGVRRTWSQIVTGIGAVLGMLTIITLLIALLAQGA